MSDSEQMTDVLVSSGGVGVGKRLPWSEKPSFVKKVAFVSDSEQMTDVLVSSGGVGVGNAT